MTDISHSLAQKMLNRDVDIFAADVEAKHQTLLEEIKGRRVLAIGAAGSIGSNTVKVLSQFEPSALHIVDQNENALAELVRQIRSLSTSFNVPDFRTLPLDYGSPALNYLLHSEKSYDIVLNFAAIKHVRSEKDPFSTLQMFDTNIIKQARLLKWLAGVNFKGRYFSVSTDKAANPSSMMGATKRLMEHVMLSQATTQGLSGPIVTARFANVLFSNGSLLESFINRFSRQEPIACPKNISRFFVSLKESGEICTLASMLLPDRHIGIPQLAPAKHLRLLTDILDEFLEFHGFTAAPYDTIESANMAFENELNQKRWPVLLTNPDTSGEKPYEEFIAKGETAREVGLTSMQGISYQPVDEDKLVDILNTLSSLTNLDNNDGAKALNSEKFKDLIATIEPEFAHSHIASSRNLDQRA